MRFRIGPKPATKKHEWHDWFAWYPVRIGSERIWLERVRRKGKFFEDSCGGAWQFAYLREGK